MDELLGIDVGATGIKGGIVDLEKGELISERFKLPTPKSGKPKDIIKVIREILLHFDWLKKPVGLGFPAIIKGGKSLSASNIDDSWIGFPIVKEIQNKTQGPIVVINDADAAGIAELYFGNGKNVKGTSILLTLGTGIGSAIFYDGVLLPNTEMGHLKYKGSIAEDHASNSARKRNDLSWEEFGKELNDFLNHVDFIFNPNLIMIGGGISKKFEEYSSCFSKKLDVVPAKKYNNAGIIGAAMAYKIYGKKKKKK
ncbi:MAG: ROK family protein [Saprospiraceae bacterium]|nr:ROK family protein [Bacteroidia bacterium]NNE14143.1 ROK family protein [Saprospiraceae bacterium]NNL90944.1 ROK family protein [Saprospiraceae bacterium]